jgi:two-component system LytT family response regulator
MLTAVIIDDELNGREVLNQTISKFCLNVEVLAMGSSVEEGKEIIAKFKPDMLFLDIEMPHGNGFELLSSINEIDFEVVFTTAYNNYALKAIKFSALDYLLKPINTIELQQAISKVELRINDRGNISKKQLEVFSENLKLSNAQYQQVVIKTLERFEIVELKTIIRCQGDRNYTNIFFTNNRVLMVTKTLKEFEIILSDHGFFRAHQSHLINISHVKKYVKGRGGYVEMADGGIIDISRHRKDAFVQIFTLQV